MYMCACVCTCVCVCVGLCGFVCMHCSVGIVLYALFCRHVSECFCQCVCLCLCMHACVHECMHVMHVCIGTHLCVHVCMHICMHTCMHTRCKLARVHANCMCACKFILVILSGYISFLLIQTQTISGNKSNVLIFLVQHTYQVADSRCSIHQGRRSHS